MPSECVCRMRVRSRPVDQPPHADAWSEFTPRYSCGFVSAAGLSAFAVGSGNVSQNPTSRKVATGSKTSDPMNHPNPERFLLCARPALISARVPHPTRYSGESFSTEPAEAADAASSEAMTDNVVKRRSFIMIHPREVRQERAEARRLNGRNARAPAGAAESAPQPKTPRAVPLCTRSGRRGRTSVHGLRATRNPYRWLR